MANKGFIMPKTGEYTKFKNYERKIKSPSIIYASILKVFQCHKTVESKIQESYMSKHEKPIACSYSCKLVCVDDNFSKAFKTYLGKDANCNFNNSMTE